MAQVVYATGVVATVHEKNGHWTKPPPWGAILAWVQGKLGLSGKEAAGAAAAIRRKIFKRGLTLPNVEGRGQMFARTLKLFESTRAHYAAFRAALLQNLRSRGA